ncbi:MAG: ribosomal protein L7/L12 [Burkholderiales bacterium]|nr:ribosomal protein L7/L12 [Burkholderiales bacterium]
MTASGPDIPPRAQSVLQTEGNLIEAIKIVREAEGIGLKEAKERVEAWIDSQPVLKAQLETRRREAKAGFWVLAILFAAGCVAALGYFSR